MQTIYLGTNIFHYGYNIVYIEITLTIFKHRSFINVKWYIPYRSNYRIEMRNRIKANSG